MKCLKDFQDDRLCDICKKIDYNCFLQCIGDYNEKAILKIYKTNKNNKLEYIAKYCPNKQNAYDEYQQYYRCSKKNNNHINDECIPCKECSKYLSEENRQEINKIQKNEMQKNLKELDLKIATLLE